MIESNFSQQELFDLAASAMNTAVTNQIQVEAQLAQLANAIKNLNKTTEEVPQIISSKLTTLLPNITTHAATTIAEKFTTANAEAEKATATFRRAQERIPPAIYIALGITSVCVLILVAFAFFLTPTIAEIANLQAKKESLANDITYLNLLKNTKIYQCTDQKGEPRLCAELDTQKTKYANGVRLIAQSH